MPQTVIHVCETCQRKDVAPENIRDGEVFADLVSIAANKVEEVEVKRFRCLAGCEEACNLAIQESGKFAYLFGRFDPLEEKANAIVEFARLYHHTDDGVVPWRERPEALKGHMRGKLPILD